MAVPLIPMLYVNFLVFVSFAGVISLFMPLKVVHLHHYAWPTLAYQMGLFQLANEQHCAALGSEATIAGSRSSYQLLLPLFNNEPRSNFPLSGVATVCHLFSHCQVGRQP